MQSVCSVYVSVVPDAKPDGACAPNTRLHHTTPPSRPDLNVLRPRRVPPEIVPLMAAKSEGVEATTMTRAPEGVTSDVLCVWLVPVIAETLMPRLVGVPMATYSTLSGAGVFARFCVPATPRARLWFGQSEKISFVRCHIHGCLEMRSRAIRFP
jgi:hypothetical protein